MVNGLALRLGRPDQARLITRPGKGMAGAAYSGGGPVAVGLKDAPGPGRGSTVGARGSIEFTTGVLSSAMLGGIVVGLGIFYIWTRGHQA